MSDDQQAKRRKRHSVTASKQDNIPVCASVPAPNAIAVCSEVASSHTNPRPPATSMAVKTTTTVCSSVPAADEQDVHNAASLVTLSDMPLLVLETIVRQGFLSHVDVINLALTCKTLYCLRYDMLRCLPSFFKTLLLEQSGIMLSDDRAILHHCFEAFADFLAAGVFSKEDITSGDPAMLIEATCEMNRLDVLRCLFEQYGGAPAVDVEHTDAPDMACRYGSLELLQYLLDKLRLEDQIAEVRKYLVFEMLSNCTLSSRCELMRYILTRFHFSRSDVEEWLGDSSDDNVDCSLEVAKSLVDFAGPLVAVHLLEPAAYHGRLDAVQYIAGQLDGCGVDRRLLRHAVCDAFVSGACCNHFEVARYLADRFNSFKHDEILFDCLVSTPGIKKRIVRRGDVRILDIIWDDLEIDVRDLIPPHPHPSGARVSQGSKSEAKVAFALFNLDNACEAGDVPRATRDLDYLASFAREGDDGVALTSKALSHALALACYNGHADCVTLLLERVRFRPRDLLEVPYRFDGLPHSFYSPVDTLSILGAALGNVTIVQALCDHASLSDANVFHSAFLDDALALLRLAVSGMVDGFEHLRELWRRSGGKLGAIESSLQHCLQKAAACGHLRLACHVLRWLDEVNQSNAAISLSAGAALVPTNNIISIPTAAEDPHQVRCAEMLIRRTCADDSIKLLLHDNWVFAIKNLAYDDKLQLVCVLLTHCESAWAKDDLLHRLGKFSFLTSLCTDGLTRMLVYLFRRFGLGGRDARTLLNDWLPGNGCWDSAYQFLRALAAQDGIDLEPNADSEDGLGPFADVLDHDSLDDLPTSDDSWDEDSSDDQDGSEPGSDFEWESSSEDSFMSEEEEEMDDENGRAAAWAAWAGDGPVLHTRGFEDGAGPHSTCDGAGDDFSDDDGWVTEEIWDIDSDDDDDDDE